MIKSTSQFKITHIRTTLFLITILLMSSCDESQEAEPTKQVTMDGPSLYQQHCSLCHGENGEGGIGKALDGPHIDEMSEAQLFMMIYEGIGSSMPDFKSKLSTDQIVDLIAFLRAL